jgi:hypothetical protein
VKKSNAALRKPPASVHVDPAEVDAFVNGGGLDVQTSNSPSVQTSEHPTNKGSRAAIASKPSRAVLERADGRTLRRMTVYLPADLAKRLAMHCVERDQDMSAVIAESVARTLGRSEG